ncbi:MAG: universal stress protein [Saprospiraceae bacterium]|nr:universal stress protein [Saprospiraceae bacterium]MDW8230406.1 universal stress protein [Saprospiraceae bacterium]
MKTILVPTDFSKCAENALQSAFALAERGGAGILVLHVVFPNEALDNNIYNAFWTEEYLQERQQALRRWTERIRLPVRFGQVKTEVMCRVGFPVPSICDVADEVKADLIVMGTIGATGLRGAILGSVAAGVMAQTTLPVLAIPKHRIFDLTVNAVLATDFKFNISEASLHVLQQVVADIKGKLHILHVVEHPDAPRQSEKEQQLSAILHPIPHEFHYLHDRDIVQATVNFIESLDAGLLIAVAHKHSILHRLFFDRTTRRLAHHAHVPLLTLHDV